MPHPKIHHERTTNGLACQSLVLGTISTMFFIFIQAQAFPPKKRALECNSLW